MRLGTLALYFVRPTRKQRSRARVERIRRAYARAAQDREFLAESAEVTKAFDATVADGLASH
jgi:hypothetical protein